MIVSLVGAGMNETYQPDWISGYMEHFFPVYMPGMMAGGDLEGGSCLSLIHYANAEEAAVCSQVRGTQIPQGTPIDIFCNEYRNTSTYPVHSIFKHRLFGKSGFLKTCFAGLLPYFIEAGHSTIDPANGNIITGPHVDDPDGPGMALPILWSNMRSYICSTIIRLLTFVIPPGSSAFDLYTGTTFRHSHLLCTGPFPRRQSVS